MGIFDSIIGNAERDIEVERLNVLGRGDTALRRAEGSRREGLMRGESATMALRKGRSSLIDSGIEAAANIFSGISRTANIYGDLLKRRRSRSAAPTTRRELVRSTDVEPQPEEGV